MRGHRAEHRALESEPSCLLGEPAAPSKGPPPNEEQVGAAQQTGAEDKRVGEPRAAGMEGRWGSPPCPPRRAGWETAAEQPAIEDL